MQYKPDFGEHHTNAAYTRTVQQLRSRSLVFAFLAGYTTPPPSRGGRQSRRSRCFRRRWTDYECCKELDQVDGSETAIAFLTRLQDDQAERTKRSHAPWRRIMSALDALHPGQKAGELLPETLQTQFLTWVPGFLGDYEKMRVVQISIRAVLGMVFVAGLGGPQATTYMIGMRWDVANHSRGEVEGFVKDVEKAIVWLLGKGGWKRPVGEFLVDTSGDESLHESYLRKRSSRMSSVLEKNSGSFPHQGG